MKSLILAAAATLAAVAPAAAQNRPFDPREYQGRHVGAATQILVIGTPHLNLGSRRCATIRRSSR